MAITINIYYTGENGSARAFAKEMQESGTIDMIRGEKGNLRYEYFSSLDDSETVLLIDSWESQTALDIHHSLPLMATISALRDKYKLHMKVERFISDNDSFSDNDRRYVRN